MADGISYYLAVSGFKGDTLDAQHVGMFDVVDFSISGAADGRFDGSDLTVTLADEAGLSAFMSAMARGALLDGATLYGQVGTTSPYDAYQLSLEHVYVTSVRDNEGGGYTVSLAYEVIDIGTRSVNAQGAVGPLVHSGWNVLENRADSTTATAGTSYGSNRHAVDPDFYYIKIDGINSGETVPAGVLAGSFRLDAVDFAAAVAAQVGLGTGKPNFASVLVTLSNDPAISTLLQSLGTGEHFAKVDILGYTDGAGKLAPQLVYSLTLEEASVNSFADGGDRGSLALGLDYTAITLKTTDVDRDGKLVTGSTQTFTWDLFDSGTTIGGAGQRFAAADALATEPAEGVHYFLAVSGFKGDTLDARHVGMFDVVDFSIAGASSGGPLVPSDLTVTLADEAGLSAFMSAMARGALLDGATLYGQVGTTSPYDAYQLSLEHVYVTSVRDNEGGGYTVSLAYEVIDIGTRSVNAQGAVGPLVHSGWNVLENRADSTTATAGTSYGSNRHAVDPDFYYIKIDGINSGETVPAGVLAGSFRLDAMDFAAAVAAQVGLGTGKPNFASVLVTLSNDPAISTLLQSLATGEHFAKVDILGYTDGAGKLAPQLVYSLTLEEASVNSFADGGDRGSLALGLDYTAITLKTTDVDRDGKLVTGSTQTFTWDLFDSGTTIGGAGQRFAAADALATEPAEGVHYFLAVSGFKGDTLDARHVGMFDVVDFSIAGASSGGPLVPSDLTVTLADEAGLSAFMSAMARGALLDGATLYGQVGTTSPYDAYQLSLEHVYVTSVRDNEGGGYTVSLAYEVIDIGTRSVNAQGAVGPLVHSGWNVLENRADSTTATAGTSYGSNRHAVDPDFYYIKIDGINSGETVPAGVLAGSFRLDAVDFAAAVAAQVGLGTGKPNFASVLVTLSNDPAISTLLQSLGTGEHFAKVDILGYTDGAGKLAPQLVYSLTLEEASVNSFADGGDRGSLALGLDYTAITLKTTDVDRDGKLVTGSTQTFTWDLFDSNAGEGGTSQRFAGDGDAPVAADHYAMDEDTTLSVAAPSGVLANDDAGPLSSVVLVDDVDHGTLQLRSDGSFVYTPDADYFGTDQFTYRLGEDTAIVIITVADVAEAPPPVNQAPVANNDALTATEDTPVTYAGTDLTGNDSDPEGSALVVTGVSSATGGTAVYNAGGSVTFTPAANFSGTAGFDYVVSDTGGKTATAHVTITVSAVNDAPVASVNTGVTLEEDGSATISGTALAFTDVDTSNASLTYTITSTTTHGGLQLNGAAIGVGATFTQADIDAGLVSYVHDGGESTSDSFGFSLSDGAGGVVTGQSFAITVTPVDDVAVAVNDDLATDEITSLTGDLFADNGNGGDFDVDGPVLAVTAVNGVSTNVGAQITLASGALLTVKADGTFSYDPNGAFGHVPTAESQASNTPGTDSFSYTLGGNTATATITVAGIDNDDDLLGTGGIDTLDGGAGDDSIDGLAGADEMIGGTGHDRFFVDDSGDLVFEKVGEGTDLIVSSVTYKLTGQYVENLTLTGTTAINGSGNSLDNLIIGNGAANVLTGGNGNDRLDGAAGADTLRGGLGDDVFIVDDAGDKAFENDGQGTDSVISSVSYNLAGQYIENLTLTGAAAIDGAGNGLANAITGNGAANILAGGGGDDRLDGGAGRDTMLGGLGNDVFVIDDSGDKAIENAGEGIDSVFSSVSFNLATQFIENLTLAGAGAINGTGNGLDNIIVGNDAANALSGLNGNDRLDGGGGSDKLTGGLGNDVYVVDNAGDRVFEKDGEGSDTVLSAVSYNLAGQFIETLTLTGTTDSNATGNSLANALNGNDGDNLINGLAGTDTLFGGLGHDTFAFTTALGSDNIDRILDFSVADDTIRLDHRIFTSLNFGSLSSNAFVVGDAAVNASDRIIYDADTGALYYDADGSGAGAAVQFATLSTHLALTAADFGIG